jgi:hypothetical protein
MFGRKTEKAGALTDEDREILRGIIAEKKKAEDPFATLVNKPEVAVTAVPGEEAKPDVPKIINIIVPPVQRELEKKKKKSPIPLIAGLIAAGFVGVMIIGGLLSLMTLMAANQLGAMMMYILGFYGFMATAIILVVVMVAYRIKLGPVWNYTACINQPGKSLMLLLRKTGVASMEVARYVAETFEKDAKPARHEDPLAFFKTDKAPNILGRAGFGVFYDAANVMANPEFVLACAELKRQGYTNIDEAKQAYLAGKLTVNVPLFAEVDFGALYDFVKGRPSIAKAYCDTKVNEARAERDQKFFDNPQIMALGFIIIMACIGIGILKVMNVI